MKLSYKYIEKVATLARDIVFGEDSDISTNPLPMELNDDIKTSMGIRILYTDSSSFDGCVLWDDRLDRPEIIISRKDVATRQEFTIIHELGHLLLHWKWLPNIGMQPDAERVAAKQSNMLDVVPLFRGKAKNKKDHKEQEANEFASDFLMPAKSIEKIYYRVYNKNANDKRNANNVKSSISSQFHVSEGAAFERVQNMQHNGEL